MTCYVRDIKKKWGVNKNFLIYLINKSLQGAYKIKKINRNILIKYYPKNILHLGRNIVILIVYSKTCTWLEYRNNNNDTKAHQRGKLFFQFPSVLSDFLCILKQPNEASTWIFKGVRTCGISSKIQMYWEEKSMRAHERERDTSLRSSF